MKTILLSHVTANNCNAMSGPFVVGFPAMTGWLGFTHALQRLLGIEVKKTGVVVHRFHLDTTGSSPNTYSKTTLLANKHGNTKKDSISPECYCSLTVSIIITYDNPSKVDMSSDIIRKTIMSRLKLVGGDINTIKQIRLMDINKKNDWYKLRRKLMPSYAIINRRGLAISKMMEGMDAADMIIDAASPTAELGWIVPNCVGYQCLTEPEFVQNQRDQTKPHRFAEPILTLCQFIMPYTIDKMDNMLWEYKIDNNLYYCE